MSLFDDAKQMVASETGGDSALVSHVVDMVKSPQSGGVEGMLQQFREKGLGGAVESWVRQEANKPIAAQDVEKVLGQDRINEIAAKFGMSPQEASAKLAQILPKVIDKLTPGGNTAAA